MRAPAIATAILLLAQAAHAESDHRKGTEGLTRLDYRVVNAGEVPLSCDVKLAHWYSDHLTTIAPGASGAFALWSDRENGAVYLMNAAGDRMPVERLWCGGAGDSWASRHEIDLPRRAGAAAVGAELSCAGSADKVRCAPR